MQDEISTDTIVNNYIKEIKADYEQKINNYEHQISKLKKQTIALENKYLAMKEERDLLLYKRFGRSSEEAFTDEKQMYLFTSECEPSEQDSITETEEVSEVKSYQRKKPGRKPIDPNIRREERIIDILESEKTCACGNKMTQIGQETSEKLEIIPMKIFVDRMIRPKYACRSCEGTEDEEKPAVKIAPVEPSMINRSITSPSLLSTIITGKFEDHLPYYRQEKQFARIGVEISRQDMSNWQQQVYNRLTPLMDLMKKTVKSGPVIQMDETVIQVMGEEGRENTRMSYMWLARGGPPDKKVIWYEYHKSRAGKHAKEILEGYSGYLQTDGYIGYDTAIKDMPGIIHVGCFAHARRKFFEASKAAKKSLSAEEGIKHIRMLYFLEDELRSQKLNEEFFLKERKARAEPILDNFKRWLLKRENEILPSGLLGQAVTYTLNQWEKMIRYLENPQLTPDNNACENAIRPFVLGRKNWVFSGSPEGAKSSCGLYSLIETAKQNSIIPFEYFMALFKKAPLASTGEDWEKLLPWNIFSS